MPRFSGRKQRQVSSGVFKMKVRRAPFFILALLCLAAGGARGQEEKLLLSLAGEWRLELGDDPRWADPHWNDSRWSAVSAPAAWEDQGFPGYDGYAWYRKHFTLPAGKRAGDLILKLGRVDDADEVYLNGEFVAFSGSFPPHYITAYEIQRSYPIPASVLKPGEENVIAVRVYDQQLSGGIVEGPLGIYERERVLPVEIGLPAAWRFRTGDNADWISPSLNDRDWKTVRVPSPWETQGFRDYDGYGWYRLHFTVPAQLPAGKLILLLGKIDDFDETYLNGERVGGTGRMPREGEGLKLTQDYEQLRAYTIPPGLLYRDRENVLAVRVYDEFLHGGIVDGPIGITTREEYLGYAKKNPKSWNWLKEMLNALFH
jgi:hypothetical protein